MPRLPILSGQEVVTALERLDFVKIRQRGSHVMPRGLAGCVVPLHEVKTGTLAGILRQAEIDPQDFTAVVQ